MAILFEDTFTGSGTLDGHTSDSGHTWASLTWSGVSGSYTGLTAADITLSGGLLEPTGDINIGTYGTYRGQGAAEPALPNEDFQLEVVIDLTGGVIDNNYLRIYWADTLTGFNPNDNSWFFTVDNEGTISANTPGFTEEAFHFATYGTDVYTIRFVVTEGTVTLFLDDVEVGTPCSYSNPGVAGQLVFMMRAGEDPGQKFVSAIRVLDMAGEEPPEPEAFWTQTVGSTETL